jgi:large subunit ribosomal protein L17
MRHKAQVSHFGRETAARKSLIRGLVCSLVEHGRIKTTLAKAKELRRHAERAVTIAKQGSLHARRLLLARYPNKAAVETMMSELGPEFKTRNGGYTRIIKLGPRPGDNAPMALIEWVNYEGPAETEVLEADEAGEGKKAKKKAAPKKAAGKAKKTAKGAKPAKKSKKAE